jgi:hypothetical protein
LLEKETIAFGKPVVLVHGDSHFFRMDKPLPLRAQGAPNLPALENFTRVETFGTPNHHWLQVTVDPNDPISAFGSGLYRLIFKSGNEGRSEVGDLTGGQRRSAALG